LKRVVEVAALLSLGAEVDVAHLPAPAHPTANAQLPSSPAPAQPTAAELAQLATIVPPPPAPALADASEAAGQGTFRQAVEDVERKTILDALDRAHGNQSVAAKLLGMSRHALVRRLDMYGLPRPRKR
jgi:DNA-binding NtrC family response regulator